MKWFRKLELKHGQSAVRNLMIVLCVMYAAGWVIQLVEGMIYYNYMTLTAADVLHGQVWRLVTWLMYPPSVNPVFGLIMIYVYWTIGRDIEYAWGSFQFDWFIIQGVIFHIIGAFLLYLRYRTGGVLIMLTPVNFSLSILLAFMASYPDAQFLLFFVVPVKAKYLGVFYAVMTVLNFIQGSAGERTEIIISLINVLVFLVISGRAASITDRFRKR